MWPCNVDFVCQNNKPPRVSFQQFSLLIHMTDSGFNGHYSWQCHPGDLTFNIQALRNVQDTNLKRYRFPGFCFFKLIVIALQSFNIQCCDTKSDELLYAHVYLCIQFMFLLPSSHIPLSNLFFGDSRNLKYIFGEESVL